MLAVLVAAANPAVRAWLHATLAEADDIAVVGEISASEEAEAIGAFDAIVYDADSEVDRMVGVANDADAALVALSDEAAIYAALSPRRLRGWALLPKGAGGAEIAAAARAAAAGLIALDRSLAPRTSRLREAAPAGDEDVSPRESLSPRESEVLQFMAQGLANKMIAARLHISLHTVKFHVASILAKLDAESRTEAVTTGLRRGYVAL